MLFSSIPFLLWFLPCVLILYMATPARFKNLILLLSSLFFYGWGEPRYLIWMLVAIVMAYIFGLLIEGLDKSPKLKKLALASSVLFSLSMLGYFKYADFFIGNFNMATGLSVPLLRIALPIGISFYTFQILSYNIDVYKKEVKAQKNLINLGTYVALFPQLIAGPIVRYQRVEEQLQHRSHSVDKVYSGISRFIVGLGKKVLIANLLGELCATFSQSGDKSVAFFWLYALAYTLQVYFDFSGYSDMAIGLGKIFGFDFPENFNYPLTSRSITEFWRRWHISLGSWFRDYVYVPLGGNRRGPKRQILNIFIVWMLTGFWHGAAWNFVVWGLYFGVLLIMEKLWLLKYLEKKPALSHVYAVVLVVISFVIFGASNMPQAFSYIKAMFGLGGYPLISQEFIYYFRSYIVVLVIAIVGAGPIMKKAYSRLSKAGSMKKIMVIVEPLALAALLIVAISFIVDGSYNPFLYFRF